MYIYFFRYIPKGMREPWTRKGELNRRYNKYQPKIQVPLKVNIIMSKKSYLVLTVYSISKK